MVTCQARVTIHAVTDSLDQFLEALDDPRREEVARLHALIVETVPELEPHVASAMLAYGHYRYRYESGREGEWFNVDIDVLRELIAESGRLRPAGAITA